MKPEESKIFKPTKFTPIEGELPEKTAYEWNKEFIEHVGIKSMPWKQPFCSTFH